MVMQIEIKALTEKERRIIYEVRQLNFGVITIMVKDSEPVNIERKVKINLD